jgi:hypothetical protein
MAERYISILQNSSLQTLLTVPHKHTGVHPTGFVIQTNEGQPSFPFTVCPVTYYKENEEPPGSNPHDVLVFYSKDLGDLETLLYTLWEQYKEHALEQTSCSQKRYLYTKTLPPRKIVIPCLGRKENLIATLKRFQMIDLPAEGYRPLLCIVEHSPYYELEKIASEYNCEYLWFFMDPRMPELPLGQFNKALCYDKSFLYTSPAEWYLFHDNDVLVPRDFWRRIDENVQRAKTKFLQPYTHRCLLNTLPAIGEYLRTNPALADTPLQEDMRYPLTPGAPGGSLYLHRQRYLEVGGHDPNFFWGYGPEDRFFFEKLSLLEPIAYADEPPIEMIHLWHPSAENNNPFRHEMDWFSHVFFQGKTLEEKHSYMKQKQTVLEMILHSIQESGDAKQ